MNLCVFTWDAEQTVEQTCMTGDVVQTTARITPSWITYLNHPPPFTTSEPAKKQHYRLLPLQDQTQPAEWSINRKQQLRNDLLKGGGQDIQEEKGVNNSVFNAVITHLFHLYVSHAVPL